MAMRDEPNVVIRRKISSYKTPQRVSVCLDSRNVAMEVGIVQGSCNNPPAEHAGPENGLRSSLEPIHNQLVEVFNIYLERSISFDELCKKACRFAAKARCEAGWSSL